MQLFSFLYNFKFSFEILAFILFLKIMTSVFIAFKAILFAFRQKKSSFKSLKVLSYQLNFVYNKCIISKWNGGENLIAFCKSLIYNRVQQLTYITYICMATFSGVRMISDRHMLVHTLIFSIQFFNVFKTLLVLIILCSLKTYCYNYM